MADKKPKTPEKPVKENVYVIPLREKCRSVPRYKKTNKAVKTVKEYIVRHMKIRDRDLKKVKLDSYLNEFLWGRGIRSPPHKVKVKAFMDGEVVRVELVEMSKKLQAKKARKEKLEKAAVEAGAKKKKVVEKPAEEKPGETPEAKGEEEKNSKAKASETEAKEDFEEKKASVVEAGKEMEKAEHKKAKHASKKQAKSMVSQRQNLAR